MGTEITWETRNLSVAVEGLKRGARDFSQKRAAAISKIALEEALRIASAELQDRGGDRAGKPGPSYLDSFVVLPERIEGDTGRVRFGIGNEAAHAPYIEYGQPAHAIGPRQADHVGWPAWRDYTRGTGRRAAAGESVWHPGAEGHFILRRAMNRAVQLQRRIL